jgi:Ca2+-binding EF-hand superfamily protein
MDENKDGVISPQELINAMRIAKTRAAQAGIIMNTIPEQEVENIMKMADLDGNGLLSIEELTLSFVHHKLTAREERLWCAFR